jgi:hypothetical protein
MIAREIAKALFCHVDTVDVLVSGGNRWSFSNERAAASSSGVTYSLKLLLVQTLRC